MKQGLQKGDYHLKNMNSEYKQKELRKIESAEKWISFISNMHEYQYNDEQYYSKDFFHEQLERVYNNLDTRVVLWALHAYKNGLENTLTECEKKRIRPTNREEMIALLLDNSEDKEKTLKRALALNYDDSGASEEAMIHYHIGCPYCNDKYCMLGDNEEPNRKTCVECKARWLNKKVDY